LPVIRDALAHGQLALFGGLLSVTLGASGERALVGAAE
jgi:hypothetical protein